MSLNNEQVDYLDQYGISAGMQLTVRLSLTIDNPPRPLWVEGTAVGATSKVLLLDEKAGIPPLRIPWNSILTIRVQE